MHVKYQYYESQITEITNSKFITPPLSLIITVNYVQIFLKGVTLLKCKQ